MTPHANGLLAGRRPRTRLVAGLCAMGLLIGACSSDGGSSGGGGPDGGASGISQQQALTGLADEVIVPGYERLATDVDALAGSVDDLCAEPSPEGLDASREAWRAAISSW